jgi:D-alanyl-D-alanine carboxypeptidase/D-alanyl-D-alanine-endopeptidase (penicillin-binding protein 4)
MGSLTLQDALARDQLKRLFHVAARTRMMRFGQRQEYASAMVDSIVFRSLTFSILLLLGACAGDTSRLETTVVNAAVVPVPEPKPPPGLPEPAAGPEENARAFQELPPATTAIALPDRRATAARIARRPVGTEVGYLLLDLETGQVLAELNADQPLIPASTAKLATAVVALDVLGPEHRYRTELLADGVIEHGVLRGDLILKGAGDPALDLADLLELAVQLDNLGIYFVNGRFLVDDTAFPVLSEIDPSQPAEAAYNPGIGPLSVAFNRVRVAWRGGRTAPITLPPLEEAQFEPAPRSLLPVGGVGLEEIDDEAVVWRVADRGRRRMASLPVKDPGLHAGRVFRQFARSQGILLGEPERGATPDNARLLALHKSAPLRLLLRDMLVYSNNMMAEMIGLAAAERLSNRPIESLDAAGALLVRHLGQLLPEIDWTSASLGNHSGLDAKARLTPRQLAAIAQYGWRNDALPGLLAGGGWSGTLAGRFGAPDEALRVWAKTGTMNYGCALAGYLFPASDRPAVFATMVSDVDARAHYDALPRPRGAAETVAATWNARARALQDGLVQVWLRPLPTS